MDHPSLYETDVFAWSQEQAAAIRALAAEGMLPSNALDSENIAQEIEDLGNSALRSVESHLERLLMHLIKAASTPGSFAFRHWLVEIDAHQRQAARRYTNAMRQRIDVDVLWRRAVRSAEKALQRFQEPMWPVPETCPFTLHELLDETIRAEAFWHRLRPDQPPL